MKKILTYTLAIAALLFAASSCDKFLDSDSPSAFDSASVYSNYSLTEGTIFGITEAFCEVNSYRGRFLPWYGFNTDIEWYNTYKPGDGKSDIAAYDCKPNNSQLNLSNGPFALMFTGIERANLVIDGLRTYGNTESDADMAYLLGEALTLRAMIYYDLSKAWGDVPARFEPVDAVTIYKPKESRDVIFKQILADLDEAIPYLPYPGATSATSRTDRINKVFAEGLYARIALAASGYALRPDDGAVGTGDLGTVRLTSDAELSKDVLYPKALKYLEDAVGKASLESDFRQYWYNLNNMNNLTAGPAYETLYVIPFGAGRGRWNFTFAVSSEGSSWSNGVSRGGDAGPVPTLYFKYGSNDQRRDVTCVNYKWSKNTVPELAGIAKWYFGKYRFEWMDAQPYTGGNDDGIKPVVMRYADILLMAEFLRKGDLIRWNMLKSKMDEAIGDMKDLRSLSGDYSGLTGEVASRISDDELSLEFIFPVAGEEIPAGYETTADYVTKYDDAKSTGFYTDRIEGIYYNNPNEYMFWPIFYDTITNSQGYIKNDYHYDNPS